METAVECRYRGRVIGVLYQDANGELAYRKYHRPSKEDMIHAQKVMNDPNPFRSMGGFYNNLTNAPINQWVNPWPPGHWL